MRISDIGTDATMSISPTVRIHPTALISPEAELGDNVVIGPYVIVEGKVRLGPDCVIRSHALLCGPLTMGRGNIVHAGAVLGERPQHLKYQDEPTSLEIGDYNIIREHVTIHRGTTHSWVTRIGHHNFFMVNSHVGHDCVVGNHCMLANNALVAGHCTLGDNVFLSGNTAVHQFTRLGRLAMLSGCSATSKDIPPFILQQGLNEVKGVNIVGMRRAGCTTEQIQAVHKAFKILFREDLLFSTALERLDQELGTVDMIQEMLAFLRQCPKGINAMRPHIRDEAA